MCGPSVVILTTGRWLYLKALGIPEVWEYYGVTLEPVTLSRVLKPCPGQCSCSLHSLCHLSKWLCNFTTLHTTFKWTWIFAQDQDLVYSQELENAHLKVRMAAQEEGEADAVSFTDASNSESGEGKPTSSAEEIEGALDEVTCPVKLPRCLGEEQAIPASTMPGTFENAS